ncbi:hypothetical protein SAMD00019534_036460 [Acytostelium subglobosum LB1]|uniref:hypothetical protein n=1 Tax=Acytostelium subglobosum LB1 TaxID=1410327 RepID=UPI000644BFA6|nr:hypothetical protein SAMD00019534_036460 [Acytostelium subglobosum LB1]GAM20471.1 hypothetical protein SAMD00019534_036460 [Acytostelium subglobosum LB1]|eukprot:XP_012759992.1 hypothetical protein SAMD00019534_036460 [Acytostelium subglobosum LB1]
MSFLKKLSKKDKKNNEKTTSSNDDKVGNSAEDQDYMDHVDFGKDGEALEPPEDKKKLWTKVSGLIGKDTMSLVSLPVYFFEPLTVLQSQVEPLRFVRLLEKACDLDNSIDRLVYITAFNIALFSSYVRTAKPFNPLLGETFEYIPKNGSYCTLSEQVSHHPPIGVCETSSARFNLQQESWITTKFWGNSVDIFSMGNNHLYLNDHNEHYSWKVPSSCCHNILVGKMWVEHHGTLSIVNHVTGDKAIITFHKSGWFEGNAARKISGEISDANGKKKFLVSGRWNEYIVMTKLDDKGDKIDEFTIWKAGADPLEKTNKWKLGSFIQSLNEINPDYEHILPPTDSRLRSDRRSLEAGDNKLANKEKSRIEDREREKRRERERTGKPFTPNYFKKVDDPQFGYRWLFNGEYWKEREMRIQKYDAEKSNNQALTDISSLSMSDDVSVISTNTVSSSLSQGSSVASMPTFVDESKTADDMAADKRKSFNSAKPIYTNVVPIGQSSH